MQVFKLFIKNTMRWRICLKAALVLFFIVTVPFVARAQQVSTTAGMAGSSGYVNAIARSARFNEPFGIACDTAGNTYVADRLNHCIRKITNSGQVTTVAGSGFPGSADGTGALASFNEPWGVACDHKGNLYVADTKNYKIRRVDANSNVTTLAGTGVFGTTNGPAATARFGFPAGIAVSTDGSVIYISDYNTHTIRKIDGGQVYTVAGSAFLPGAADGAGATAGFNHPCGLALLPGGQLLIADEWNAKIRSMTPAGLVTTVAGTGFPGVADGPLSVAQFNSPSGITADNAGNAWVADASTHTIRKLDFTTGMVSTPAGSAGQTGSTDGNGTAARFNSPSGIAFSSTGSLMIADRSNHTIRQLSNTSSIVLNLTVSAGNPLCEGDSIRIVTTPTGLSTYIMFIDNQPADTSINGRFIISSIPAGNHTLMISAIDNSGAVASSTSIPLTVSPGFTPFISSSAGNTLCTGTITSLSVSGGSSVLWSTGATTASIQTGMAGTYTVTSTGGNGCRGTSSPFLLNVSTGPVPVVQIQQDTVCPGQTTVLSTSSGNSWLWSNGATSASINAGAGTYQVTVTLAGGCTGTSVPLSIHMFSVIPPSITPSGTVLILQGDSVQLQATGGISYSWSNGTTGDGCYASLPGIYSVTAITADGCTSTAQPVIVQFINPSSMLTVSGTLTFCDGDSVLLQSMFPSGNQWYRNGQPLPGADDPYLIAYESGWYSVAVVQNSVLLQSDSVLVTVLPRPGRPELADTATCPGSGIDLLINDPGNNVHRWYDSPENGNLLNQGPLFSLPAVTQGISVFIETESVDGCLSDERYEVQVVLYPGVTAGFTHTVSTTGSLYDVNFNSSYADATSWQWYFGDASLPGNFSLDEHPTFSFPRPGLYDVSLVVTNIYGCSDSVHKRLYIGADFPAFIPTTFTPNGDGKNDLFRVRGEKYKLQEMLIYDQWGTLIFSTDGSVPFWDGRVNGEVAQNATYFYKVRIVDTENNYFEKAGPVTLIK